MNDSYCALTEENWQQNANIVQKKKDFFWVAAELLFAVAHLSNIVCVFFWCLETIFASNQGCMTFLNIRTVILPSRLHTSSWTNILFTGTRARTYRQVHANQARPSLVLMGFRLLWLYTNHMNLQAWGTPADTLHIRLRWKWYGALKLAQNCMHKSEEALLSWAEEVNGEKDVEWSKERDGESLKWIGEMKR